MIRSSTFLLKLAVSVTWNPVSLKMEACVRDIDLWMLCNRLKLNQDKTEVLIFSSPYRPRPSLDNLTIVDEIVACSPMARNIGVVFDNSLSMVSHVNAVCKSAFFHLHKISKTRKFLNDHPLT